ncbi:MAG TPA: VWA domain-containing protein, partial [Pyrinomonadaceae bacterium]|nr:VWA domain-containing protein [Pyrinomonadaceae bacterium]
KPHPPLFEVRMFFRTEISRALVYGLAFIVVFACIASVATRAQNQNAGQDSSRPRRTDATTNAQPQARPTPTPTPGKKDEDITVDSDDVVRVETDLTNILFTAIDKNKRFITEMRKEDIRITEDGTPQEIFTFERQTDRPLSLALLIDTSGSEERTLPAEKRAAAAFVDSVMRAEKDELAVISFTGESTLEQGLTGNVARVRRALERVEFVPPSGYIGGGIVVPGTPPISGTNQSLAGSTAIWESVWVTSEDVLSQTSDKTRRAIILLTDGEDTISQKKMAEAIERAIKNDVVVYAIGIGDPEYGINEGSLKKLAERTGGRAFFPDDESELRAAFSQIQLELRSQFLVAYSPTNKNRDGSFRKVQIEIVNPDMRKQSLRLNYRQGYFARTVTASTKDE